MSLDPKLQHRIQHLLTVSGDSGTRGVRWLDDAARLWQRVQRLRALNLTPPDLDADSMELACYALQLPMRQGKGLPVGKFGQISLRERAEQAAELLIGAMADHAPEDLLDRTSRILHELPVRSTEMPEVRLLADALNLDDFGVTGLMLQAMQLSRQHGSLSQLAEGLEKRQEYGYWEARLKDGFHFEPIRQIARQRLEQARKVAAWLLRELKEDQPQ